MDKQSLIKRTKDLPRLVGTNIAVFLGLFILFESALHVISPKQNPLLGPPFVPSKVRVAHPVYSHGLRPNYEDEEQWGIARSKIITNSLGFRDAKMREVPLRSDRKRVLFMGDSFVEGVGLPYEETFAGRFAAAFPQIDVLNGGVVSYSPSVYYSKTRYFIEQGFKFDEVVVYIDISDVQDEALAYRPGNDGVVEGVTLDPECPSAMHVASVELPWWTRISYTLDLFYRHYALRKVARYLPSADLAFLVAPGGPYAANVARASWTYDPQSPCYGRLGLEGAIAQAVAQMDKLYALLSEHGIPISLGVYPWPQQLLYDTENSRQVTLWRGWCENKCRRFFNHFATMFAYKRDNPNYLRDLFIWGDIHYNSFGNLLIARDLIAQYP